VSDEVETIVEEEVALKGYAYMRISLLDFKDVELRMMIVTYVYIARHDDKTCLSTNL
jgi:hypothetical protein